MKRLLRHPPWVRGNIISSRVKSRSRTNKEVKNVLIKSLSLLTVQLEELRHFYTVTLGLTLMEESQDYFTVQVGLSKLTFLRSLETFEKPYYHFAFEISNNKIQDSIRWLEERKVDVNQLSDHTYLAYSKAWDSTSIYFYDPAGNILEFIARHGLRNAREGHFQNTDVLRISEIGLAVPDVPLTKKVIRSMFSLTEYKDFNDRFAAVGDEVGLFILAECQRVWLGSDKPAEIFKTVVEIECSVEGDVIISDLPYRIISREAEAIQGTQ